QDPPRQHLASQTRSGPRRRHPSQFAPHPEPRPPPPDRKYPREVENSRAETSPTERIPSGRDPVQPDQSCEGMPQTASERAEAREQTSTCLVQSQASAHSPDSSPETASAGSTTPTDKAAADRQTVPRPSSDEH